MSQRTDWLPGPRAEIVSMCQSWLTCMTEDRRTACGIPQTEFTALNILYLTARGPSGGSSAR